MSTSNVADYEDILTIVRTWPATQRFTLVQEVLKTLAPVEEHEQPSKRTLDQARGLLATGRPVPTDEEITQWLEERRTERYGR
jgi:hypothetical protein